jgi:hypothetical protein
MAEPDDFACKLLTLSSTEQQLLFAHFFPDPADRHRCRDDLISHYVLHVGVFRPSISVMI